MTHWLDKIVEILTAETNSLKELAKIAGGDLKTFYNGIDPSSLELEGQDIDGIEFTKFFLERIEIIRSKRNKDERVIMILDWIMQSPKDATLILENYVDTSKFANMFLGEVRKLLSEGRLFVTIDRMRLVRAMRRPLGHQMPRSRGDLIYYMAKHLAKYPEIRSYLRKSYAKFSSRDWDRYRPEIERYLGLDN